MPNDVISILNQSSSREFDFDRLNKDIGMKADPILDLLTRTDRAVDDSGIPHMGLRAGLSRADTDEEKDLFLTKMVGRSGFTKDKFGRYAITPKGKKILGIEAGDRPTLIDSPAIHGIEKGDFADMAGSLPPVIGGIGGAMAATGVGLVPGMALTALGAAGGKGIDEAIEAMQGRNLQSPLDVGKDLAIEGGLTAAGEGVARGLGAVGRYALAPERKRMTHQGRKLLREAKELGVNPPASSITRAPIQGSVSGMVRRFFGSADDAMNSRAINREMFNLRKSAGKNTLKSTLGETVEKDIKRARGALSRWAKIYYGKIDEVLGGEAVFPTASLKQTAADILSEMPLGTNGKPVFTSPETQKLISDALGMEDFITSSQLQAVRQRLWDAIDDKTLVPGLGSRNARLLRDAATQSYDDAVSIGKVSPDVAELIKKVNSRYSKEIKKFDDALVSRITREPGLAGRIEPETIVPMLFKKGQHSAINRILPMMNETTKGKFRRVAMDDLFRTMVARDPKTPLESVFTGNNFLKTLDDYGQETLDAVFGKEVRKRLYRLGEVVHLISPEGESGSIVAANIAVRPWAHLGKLAQMGIISKIMSSKAGLKYLTEGFDLPKTRAASMFTTRLATMIKAVHEDKTSGTMEPINGSQ